MKLDLAEALAATGLNRSVKAVRVGRVRSREPKVRELGDRRGVAADAVCWNPE